MPGHPSTFERERSAVFFQRGLSKRQVEHSWAPCSERRVARAGGAKPNILASLLGSSWTSTPCSPRPNQTRCRFDRLTTQNHLVPSSSRGSQPLAGVLSHFTL